MFLPSHTRVYLALGHTDMRKSLNELSILVETQLQMDPFSGHLFFFCNRRCQIIKSLYWDRNGFALWHKRLEKHRFSWPQSEKQLLCIDARQLSWLLEALPFHQIRAHAALNYCTLT